MDRIKRQRRQHRIRARVRGTAVRPRVSVYRSNYYVWLQLIDDETGRTLAAVHGKAFPDASKLEQAQKVGEAMAAVALAAGITAVVFDRSGYLYHGRVKAVAESLRQGGLSV